MKWDRAVEGNRRGGNNRRVQELVKYMKRDFAGVSFTDECLANSYGPEKL